MANLDIPSRLLPDFRVRMPEHGVESATFLMTYHSDADDLPMSLRHEFEEADVVFHERIGWTQEEIDGMNKVARGEEDLDVFGSDLNLRVVELMRDTHGIQTSWDVPAGHLSTDKYRRYFAQPHAFRSETDLKQNFDMVVSRDKLALRTVGLRIDKLVAEGVLRPKPRVLVLAGLSHVVMANAFREATDASVNIKTSYPDMAADAATDYILDTLNGRVKPASHYVVRRAMEIQVSLSGLRPYHEIAAKAAAMAVDSSVIEL